MSLLWSESQFPCELLTIFEYSVWPFNTSQLCYLLLNQRNKSTPMPKEKLAVHDRWSHLQRGLSTEVSRVIFSISTLSWADLRMPPLGNLLLWHTAILLLFTSIPIPIFSQGKTYDFSSLFRIHLLKYGTKWFVSRSLFSQEELNNAIQTWAIADNIHHCILHQFLLSFN